MKGIPQLSPFTLLWFVLWSCLRLWELDSFWINLNWRMQPRSAPSMPHSVRETRLELVSKCVGEPAPNKTKKTKPVLVFLSTYWCSLQIWFFWTVLFTNVEKGIDDWKDLLDVSALWSEFIFVPKWTPEESFSLNWSFWLELAWLWYLAAVAKGRVAERHVCETSMKPPISLPLWLC